MCVGGGGVDNLPYIRSEKLVSSSDMGFDSLSHMFSTPSQKRAKITSPHRICSILLKYHMF